MAYTCQRCSQPLLLDATLGDLSQEQYDIIAGSLPADDPDPAASLAHLDKLARIPAQPESKSAYLSALQERDRRRTRDPAPPRHVGLGGHRHPAESYVLLSQSQIAPPPPPPTAGQDPPGIQRSNTTLGLGTPRHAAKPSPSASSKHSLTASLLSLLTSRTPHDHPLCADCAKALQDQLQSRLEDVQRERDAYISFERGFQDAKRRREADATAGAGEGADTQIPLRTSVYDTFSPSDLHHLERHKTTLTTTHAALLTRLAALEAESTSLAAEEAILAAEETSQTTAERAFLVHAQQVDEQLHDARARLATERTCHMLATQTLARLESANVYNDVFQIGHVPLLPGTRAGDTGQTVGTINGLRLGGRPVVDWVEINAALGLVALCIDRIAVKVGCTFETYKIVPLGSFSRVDELPPSKNSYELYASTDLSAARLLQNRRFNYALCGMLDCLRQLIGHGKARGRGWARGGIEIQKDKIAGHSIKLSANMGMSSLGLVGSVSVSGSAGAGPTSTEAEESWTRALRAVLAVLKRILVMESEADRDERG